MHHIDFGTWKNLHHTKYAYVETNKIMLRSNKHKITIDTHSLLQRSFCGVEDLSMVILDLYYSSENRVTGGPPLKQYLISNTVMYE